MSELDVHVMYQINALLTTFFFLGGWGVMIFVSLFVQRSIFDRNKANQILQRTFLSTDRQHQVLLSILHFVHCELMYRVYQQSNSKIYKGKGKAIPLQAWTGPKGS